MKMAVYCKVGAVLALALLLSVSANAAESDTQKIERLERAVDELKQQIEELKRELVKPEPAARRPPRHRRRRPLRSRRAKVSCRRYSSACRSAVRLDALRSELRQQARIDLHARRLVVTADGERRDGRSTSSSSSSASAELEPERIVEAEEGGLKVEQEVEGTNESRSPLEQAGRTSCRALEGDRSVLVQLGGSTSITTTTAGICRDARSWIAACPCCRPRRPGTRSAPDSPEISRSASWERSDITCTWSTVRPCNRRPRRSCRPAARAATSSARGEVHAQTGTFGNDVKDAKAVTGRLAWSPALGHELAGSFYTARYTPDSCRARPSTPSARRADDLGALRARGRVRLHRLRRHRRTRDRLCQDRGRQVGRESRGDQSRLRGRDRVRAVEPRRDEARLLDRAALALSPGVAEGIDLRAIFRGPGADGAGALGTGLARRIAPRARFRRRPSDRARKVAPPVQEVLREACYDCHSNQTRWPWYSALAPMSWLIQHDVMAGRRRLNFSDWTDYASDPETAAEKLRKVAKAVTDGNMAPRYYQMLRPRARVDERGGVLYHTRYGGESAPTLSRSDRGKAERDRLLPSQDIRNIAGATLSARAVGRRKQAISFTRDRQRSSTSFSARGTRLRRSGARSGRFVPRGNVERLTQPAGRVGKGRRRMALNSVVGNGRARSRVTAMLRNIEPAKLVPLPSPKPNRWTREPRSSSHMASPMHLGRARVSTCAARVARDFSLRVRSIDRGRLRRQGSPPVTWAGRGDRCRSGMRVARRGFDVVGKASSCLPTSRSSPSSERVCGRLEIGSPAARRSPRRARQFRRVEHRASAPTRTSGLRIWIRRGGSLRPAVSA